MLCCQIHLCIRSTPIISIMCCCTAGIIWFSGHGLCILDIADQCIVLCILIDLPAITTTFYLYDITCCSSKISCLANCIILCSKICYVLLNRILIKSYLHIIIYCNPLRDYRTVHNLCVRRKVQCNIRSQFAVHLLACLCNFR